jgi:hypothetical protein
MHRTGGKAGRAGYKLAGLVGLRGGLRVHPVQNHECRRIARQADNIPRGGQGFDVEDGVVGWDKHKVGLAGGIQGAVVAAARCVHDHEVGPGRLGGVERVAEPGRLRGNHGGRLVLAAPVFPLAGARLRIEVNDGNRLPRPHGCDGQAKGYGRLTGSAFLADY